MNEDEWMRLIDEVSDCQGPGVLDPGRYENAETQAEQRRLWAPLTEGF